MFPLIEQKIRQHHESKMQEARYKAEGNIKLLQAGFNGEVPEGVAFQAYQDLQSSPSLKDHKEVMSEAVRQQFPHWFSTGKVQLPQGQQNSPATGGTGAQPSQLTGSVPQQVAPAPQFNPLSPPPSEPDQIRNDIVRAGAGNPLPSQVPPITSFPLPPVSPISAQGSPPAPGIGFITPFAQRGENKAALEGPAYESQAKAHYTNEYGEKWKYEQARAKEIQGAITDPETGEIKLDPKSMATIASYGVQLPYIGRLMIPQQLQIDASQMNPDQLNWYHAKYGEAPKGKVTVSVDPMTQQTVNMFPGWVGTQTVTTPGGGVGLLNKGTGDVQSVAGATPSFMERPQAFTNAYGGQFYQSPAAVGRGALGTTIPEAQNAAYAPTVRTGESFQRIYNPETKQIEVQAVPFSSRTQKVPGAAPAPMAPPPGTATPGTTAPRAPAAPPARTVPKPRVVGVSAEQGRMELENPLTPAGQKVMEETDPVLAQVDRAIALLEPVKGHNIPFGTSLERVGYSLGMATEASRLINNLEIGKITGSARLLKGSSRAIQALELAMQHLPDPKKDSSKLMYEKLLDVKRNIGDIQAAAQKWERKHPGMAAPPAGGGGKITVNAGGKTYLFDDQASADAFKKAAGVK